MTDIVRCHFIVIKGDGASSWTSYVRPSRLGVFCDMNGVPLDAEQAEFLHRGRLAEFLAMEPSGIA